MLPVQVAPGPVLPSIASPAARPWKSSISTNWACAELANIMSAAAHDKIETILFNIAKNLKNRDNEVK